MAFMKRERSARLAILAVAAALLAARAARADEVRLENGDVLHGTIESADEKVLHMKHAFGTEVTVPMDKIVAIETDQTLPVALADGNELKGKVAPGPGTSTAVVTSADAGKTGPFSLRRVIRIGAPPPYIIWSGKIALGMTINSGNTSAKSYFASFDGQGQSKDFLLEGHGYYTYAETEGVATTRRSYARAQFDYIFYAGFYAYVGGALEYDKFADLRLRARGGGGAGYAIFSTPDLGWRVEAGLQYVNQEHFVAADEDFAAARFATTFEWQIIESLRFRQYLELDPNLDNFHDFLAHSESSIAAAIWKGFGAQFSVIADYENQPPGGRKHTDVQYIFSLTYVF